MILPFFTICVKGFCVKNRAFVLHICNAGMFMSYFAAVARFAPIYPLLPRAALYSRLTRRCARFAAPRAILTPRYTRFAAPRAILTPRYTRFCRGRSGRHDSINSCPRCACFDATAVQLTFFIHRHGSTRAGLYMNDIIRFRHFLPADPGS